MYRIVFLLIIASLFGSCHEQQPEAIRLPYYNRADFTPLFLSNSQDIEKHVPHTIADFEFLNQDSALINQHTIENKIHVANFIFTRCGSICPAMTDNLKLVSDSLGNDSALVFLSYSVTPWIDKPHILKKFKEKHQIRNKNWHFITGNKGDIYKLARQSYFAEEDLGFSKDSTNFLHTEHFILVDPSKRIRGVYNGTLRLEMEQLADDIRTLQQEIKR